MSQDHDVRDRIAENLKRSGYTPAAARQEAIDSLNRCARDKKRDTRKK